MTRLELLQAKITGRGDPSLPGLTDDEAAEYLMLAYSMPEDSARQMIALERKQSFSDVKAE